MEVKKIFGRQYKNSRDISGRSYDFFCFRFETLNINNARTIVRARYLFL